MTTKARQNSKPAGRSPKCADCMRVEKYQNQNPSRDNFCPRHQCPIDEIPGITCSTRKRSSADRCINHSTLVLCNMEGCNNDCFAYSSHCEIHSCSIRGCQREARPGFGRDFCDAHKCADRDCQQIRKRIEIDGRLKMAQFCRQHECQIKNCISKKYPGKGFCVAHCCNIDSCPDSRQGGHMGPLCIPHYNESIKKSTFADIQRHERIRSERAAQTEQLRKTELQSRARAEEQRRRELEARAQAEEKSRREQDGRGRSQYRSHTPHAPKMSETMLFSERERDQDRFERSFPIRQAPIRDPNFDRKPERERFYERETTPPLKREDAYLHDDFEYEHLRENDEYDDNDRDSAYISESRNGEVTERERERMKDRFTSKRAGGLSFGEVEREREWVRVDDRIDEKERRREPAYGYEQKESVRPRRREKEFASTGMRGEPWRDDVRGW